MAYWTEMQFHSELSVRGTKENDFTPIRVEVKAPWREDSSGKADGIVTIKEEIERGGLTSERVYELALMEDERVLFLLLYFAEDEEFPWPEGNIEKVRAICFQRAMRDADRENLGWSPVLDYMSQNRWPTRPADAEDFIRFAEDKGLWKGYGDISVGYKVSSQSDILTKLIPWMRREDRAEKLEQVLDFENSFLWTLAARFGKAWSSEGVKRLGKTGRTDVVLELFTNIDLNEDAKEAFEHWLLAEGIEALGSRVYSMPNVSTGKSVQFSADGREKLWEILTSSMRSPYKRLNAIAAICTQLGLKAKELKELIDYATLLGSINVLTQIISHPEASVSVWQHALKANLREGAELCASIARIKKAAKNMRVRALILEHEDVRGDTLLVIAPYCTPSQVDRVVEILQQREPEQTRPLITSDSFRTLAPGLKARTWQRLFSDPRADVRKEAFLLSSMSRVEEGRKVKPASSRKR